jgi:hypothetical protein
VVSTDGPLMVFTIATVTGQQGAWLRRQQAAALRAAINWHAAHPEEPQHSEQSIPRQRDREENRQCPTTVS